MPRYRYIYEQFQHGEQHPDDASALEAVDEAKRRRGLIRVERLLSSAGADLGGSSPQCRLGDDGVSVKVIWEA